MNDDWVIVLVYHNPQNCIDGVIRALGGPLLVGHHRNKQAPDTFSCEELFKRQVVVFAHETPERTVSGNIIKTEASDLQDSFDA